ncbi:hypothetical protein POJ06DRAFT_258033 [Lipomyces tetrasporus]|uniref:Uncharacterized protein n=1 Tax=Lipomyces tetrasporus TaxID=54092 RepID=A0AAD7VQC7_9ASCO|nr:uncharacterized protein POJ06DRAFT_258033 [Lipomyces tetrasporus]KAJ8098797.1 hypothetical protein POJ06DRAFT_258033 [Lipomyces tetrasporus]
MPHTPLRRLVIHHDAADDNKENIPPSSFSTSRNSKHGSSQTPTAGLGSRQSEHAGTRHSALKTVYSTLSSSARRMPLREIFVSSPATPENAFVEYYIPDTSLVEPPIPESPMPVPTSLRNSSSPRKHGANRESTSSLTTAKLKKKAPTHKPASENTSLQNPRIRTRTKKDRAVLAPKAQPLAADARPSSTCVPDKKTGASAGTWSLADANNTKPKQKQKLTQAGTKSSSGMILLR